MQGNADVLKLMQEVLTAELTAINQYFLHAKMMDNWGYERLAKIARKKSIEDMRHAETLMERILFFDGSPDMSMLFKLKIGRNVKEQLESDLKLESETCQRLNKAIAHAVKHGDNGSRDMFEELLRKEEDFADFLEAQLHQIKEMGYEKYLSMQLDED